MKDLRKTEKRRDLYGHTVLRPRARQNSYLSLLSLSLMVLSLYLIQSASSALTPVMAEMTAHFSNYAVETVMLLATLPSLASIFSSLLLGIISKKLGFKNTLVIAFTIYLIGGLLPLVVFDSLPIVLGARLLLGLGNGVLYPAGITLVTKVIEESKRGKHMGIGSTCATVSGVIYTLSATVLMGLGLNGVFLVHAVAIIPFVLVLICPREYLDDKEEPTFTDNINETAAAPVVKEGYGALSWFWQILGAFLLLFYFTSALYISLIITELGGGVAEASLASTISLIAGAVSGVVFGKMMSLFKSKFITVLSIVAAIGFALVFFANNIIMIYAGNLLIGFGYMALCPYVYMMLAATTPASRLAGANGNAGAFINIAAFVGPYVLTAISSLFKMQSLQSMFAISAGFYAVLAVVFLFVGNKFLKTNE